MPYLATYLIYAWLHWPVNVAGAGSDKQEAGSWVPPLLYIYWFLHGMHLGLAALTLVTWWRNCTRRLSAIALATDDSPQPIDCSLSTLDRLWPVVPWILLVLIIWIPGVYLEFPSDPVAHLGRIVEWSQAVQVAENGGWLKASYFFAYSITSLGQPETFELFLRLYYTSMCILLSWQSYRLALAMKLGTPAAFFFTALQLVVFGNSTFSYHRYYGLSSTIVSHLAVVALLRIWLGQITAPQFMRTLGGALLASVSLLALVVFNHIQGVLIVFVSLIALGFWWLSRHNKTVLVILFALLAAVSAALIAKGVLSPAAALTKLQEAGWLNSAGSFNLFQGGSPAQHRALELIGIFGLGSSALALLMFQRNHPGAWMMTVPWAFLLVPATAYPLALYLHGDAAGFMRWFHGQGMEQISVFSRQLFAMPLALPFAWLLSELLDHPRWGRVAPMIPLTMLWVVLILPVQGYFHARLWQTLARTPDDLELKPVREIAPHIRYLTAQGDEKKIIGGSGTCYLLEQMGAHATPFARRMIPYPVSATPAQDQSTAHNYLVEYWRDREFLLVLPQPVLFVSSASQAALISRHWLPQEVPLSGAGEPELAGMGRKLGFREWHPHHRVLVLTNIP